MSLGHIRGSLFSTFLWFWVPEVVSLPKKTKFAITHKKIHSWAALLETLLLLPYPSHLTQAHFSAPSSSDLWVGLFLLAICYKRSWAECKTISNFAKDAKFPEVDQSDYGELFESHARILASENIAEFSQLTITEEKNLAGWWNDRHFKRERFEF